MHTQRSPAPSSADAAARAAGHAAAAPTTWGAAFTLAWRVFLPVRLMLSLVGAATFLQLAGPPANRSLGGWLDWLLVQPWGRFDSGWYLRIAEGGYAVGDGRAAFHPLLPLLMRVLGDLLGGHYLLAGLIVSNAACLVFLAALFRFAALSHGPALAAESLYWALYTPLGFALLLPYTESLLLCFTLLALWYAHQDRWLAAGICACLAALAKQPGAALVLPLLWTYAAGHRGRLLQWKSLRVLACLSLAPLGYLGFALYRAALDEAARASPAALLGSLLISRQLSSTWGTRFAPPWEWLVYVTTTPPRFVPIGILEGVLTVAGLTLAALALRRERAPVVIYGLIQILLATTLIIADQPLQSMARRISLVFPIYTQLARWSLGARLRLLWLALAAALMCGFAIGFCTLRFTP